MNQGIRAFNSTMIDALVKNRRYLIRRPSYFKKFANIASGIQKQAKIRKHLFHNEGLIIPPVLILSVTNNCNLQCAGCYARSQHRDRQKEMSSKDIERVIDEAVDAGVAVFLLAGGEPLLKDSLLDMPKKHKHTLFVMFTNGLLLSQDKIDTLPKNMIPVISIEGGEQTTDARRGTGMYAAVMDVMARLDRSGQLFGASVTLTRNNFNEIMLSDYLGMLEEKGCGVVFLIEYVPGPDDMDLCLTDTQKQQLCDMIPDISKQRNMLIIPLPGDEDKYDGCLAAGRGFMHISAAGALEACPFAPYSDTNVLDKPFVDAMRSGLLKKIRDNHHLLTESRGGCALNENRDWIKTLMHSDKNSAN